MMTMRERGMVALAGFLLILLPLYAFVLEPQAKALTTSRTQARSLAQSLSLAQTELETRQVLLKRDPNQPLRQALQEVDAALEQVDEQLQAQTVDLISARQMPDVLRRLLAESGKLRLLSLASLSPTPLLPEEGPVNFYQHGLRLRFAGGFADTYRYLRALEQLPEHFYWQRLEYQVGQYPLAEVELELYTLSDNKEFIGG
ncbi:MSHA biogenesis protein MshJ [Pseudaeromonas sp. ZJS20]|uniref:MSHA biogenesis protein MshJ n=1 Tax=Pseudaeromonas aegiceratis TaxID=3153928 RepID=UPI00390CA5B2